MGELYTYNPKSPPRLCLPSHSPPHTLCTALYTHSLTHARTHARTHTHTHARTHTLTHTHTYTHTRTHSRTHSHTHTHARTHTHTHTHTHTRTVHNFLITAKSGKVKGIVPVFRQDSVDSLTPKRQAGTKGLFCKLNFGVKRGHFKLQLQWNGYCIKTTTLPCLCFCL